MALNLLLGVLSFFGAASASNNEIISSPVEKVFVPNGFDDNDNVEIVVFGHFTNTCFKVGPSDSKVDSQAKIIYISPKSYEYTNAICAQMMVPFTQVAKIGVLEAGTYKVVIENSSSVPATTVTVNRRHNDAPDDYIYAPVDEAKVDFVAEDNQHFLTVKGLYPLTFVGCAIMRDVRIIKPEGGVIVVQPIMDLISNSSECRTRNWSPRFDIRVPINYSIQPDDYLLHVRVTNGNSLNKVFVSNQE